MKKYKKVNLKERIKIIENNRRLLSILYKKARKENNYPEAIWFFYSIFENILISLIFVKMQTKNRKADSLKEKHPYSIKFINKALKLNKTEVIIKTFCLLYGDSIYRDLKRIQTERNDVQHRLLKTKNLTEEKINTTLKNFFIKSKIELFLEKIETITKSMVKEIKSI